MRHTTPDLFFSDISDVAWRSQCKILFFSGLWPKGETATVNLQDLCVVMFGLLRCALLLQGKVVGICCDSATVASCHSVGDQPSLAESQ